MPLKSLIDTNLQNKMKLLHVLYFPSFTAFRNTFAGLKAGME